jgi:hypothetical protein
MRIRSVLLVLLAYGIGIIVGRSVGRDPSPDLTQSQAESKAGLDRLVGPVDFAREAPTLKAAIDYLRKESRVPLVVDWTALEATPFPGDLFVFVRTDAPAPLGSVLQLLFWSCRRGDQVLDYAVDDSGAVLIGTPDQLGKHDVVLRIYDIDDLTQFQGAHFGDTVARFLRESPGDEISRREYVDTIIKLIEDSVQPESWKDNGGQVGSIREVGGMLIVTTNQRAHRELTTLLAKMRSTIAQRKSLEAGDAR